MVSIFLLAAIAVSALGVFSPIASEPCTNTARTLGLCSVDASVGAGDVTLSGTRTDSGNAAASSTHIPNNAKAHSGTGSSSLPARCIAVVNLRCKAIVAKPAPAAPARDSFTTTTVTLRDIASFRPTPGSQQMEPNGWVVTGLDANFYVIIGQQLVPGTLLGQPAVVRFTPVRYHWNYGDGSTAVRATPGGTWASQGLRDFDPTPTSHIYAAEGEYTIRLSIDFRAEYAFGASGFRPIVGVITLPANDLYVSVTGAKTVLVAHDCVAAPSDPGC